MDHPERTIEMALNEREARMLGFDRAGEIILKSLLQVKDYHLTARGHYVEHLELI